MEQKIKYATSINLTQIARCHIAAFPESLSSKLGVSFVSHMFTWYLSGANKFLFYVEDQQKVLGYCGGYVVDGTDSYGASSGMMQSGFSAALKALAFRPWLLLHPELLKRYQFIFINLLRKTGLKREAPLAQQLPELKNEPLTAGLVVIGVLPNLQQKGLGTLLQQEFERKAKEMGAEQLQLSVRTQNERAIRSYQKNGYHISEETTTSYIMIKPLI